MLRRSHPILQRPIDKLFELQNRFGLTDILLAADRSVGKRSIVGKTVLIAQIFAKPTVTGIFQNALIVHLADDR